MENTIIAEAEYEIGNKFRIEQSESIDTIKIYVYNLRNNKLSSEIWFDNIGEEYKSPFLSWYNLIFCSNNYGPCPNYKYMNRAVQEGKKTAATVYIRDEIETNEFISRISDNCEVMPYDENILYVYNKGCLSDFFDIGKIKNLYICHGITELDWDKIQFLANKPLSFFGNQDECKIDLQSGGLKEDEVIKGLVLGYPVESTIASIKHNIKIYREKYKN